MSLTLPTIWFSLVLAIPSVFLAQGVVPQIPQPHARDTEAEKSQYLQDLDKAIKAAGDQRPVIYRLHSDLADLLAERHEYAEAAKYYQLAYNAAKTLFGDQSLEAADNLTLLGKVQLQEGVIWEADRAFHQAQKILETDRESNRFKIAIIVNNLAAVQIRVGNLSRAAALMRQAAGIFEMDQARQNEQALATVLSNLATVLRRTGNRPEAKESAEKALSIQERGASVNDLALSLVVLSRLHLDEGDSDAAEAMLQRALRKIESQAADETPTLAHVLGHLGMVYSIAGKYREAEANFLRAIEIDKRFLRPEHPDLLDAMGGYAEFLRRAKRKDEAKKLEASIREQRAKYRVQNPATAAVVDVHSLLSRGSR